MNEPNPTALIVEDEPQIRRFVRAALEAQQWQVAEAGTVKAGLIEAGTRRPNLVILDLGLPDGDGVGYLRDLRTWSQVPVIVLSARVDEADKIAALDAGADDYLTKPFAVGELMARVRAALRRGQRAPDKRQFDVLVRRRDGRLHSAARATRGRRRAPHAHRVPAARRADRQCGEGAHAPQPAA